jgi:hypothetical protein
VYVGVPKPDSGERGTSARVDGSLSGHDRVSCAADGSLAASAVSSIAVTGGQVGALAYSPSQARSAALGAPSSNGLVATFDASGSQAVNGTIGRYDWSFGDGTTLSDGGPTPSHAYAAAGDYTARVTVFDSAGCSVPETYTGTFTSCIGSPGATVTQSVHVMASAVLPPTADPSHPGNGGTNGGAALRLKASRHTSGKNVLLTWTKPRGAVRSTRYLVAWSTTHSSQGPGDRFMRHLHWKKATHILMRGFRPGTTIHYAVYAYASDGTLTSASKTTLRIKR